MLHELGLGPERIDGGGAGIAHARSQAADHLVEHVGDGTLVGDAPFDAFRHELLGGDLAVLEVAVGAAILHRGERAHAADHLEATALGEDRFARALLGAQRASSPSSRWRHRRRSP
jgi:hypothetical protein